MNMHVKLHDGCSGPFQEELFGGDRSLVFVTHEMLLFACGRTRSLTGC